MPRVEDFSTKSNHLGLTVWFVVVEEPSGEELAMMVLI
jgi:hypothetical protein